MLSSLNSYSGLSSADILMLFGANSASSSSSSASASVAQSASSSAPSFDATDPAATIKAVLAQSELVVGAVSANIETVAAAYAAQTAGSNVVTGAAAMASSQGAGPLVNNIGPESGSSLVVATANGLESITTGSDTQIATMMQDAALANYANASGTTQQTLSGDLIPASTTDASSTPAPDGTSASGASPQAQQSVLLLRVAVEGGGFPGGAAPPSLNTLIGTVTQQLVSSLENNTLSSTSTPATGFSYSAVDGQAIILITGIEASVSEPAPITDTISQSNGTAILQSNGTAIPDFLTTVAAGDYDFFSDSASNVIIPLGVS